MTTCKSCGELSGDVKLHISDELCNKCEADRARIVSRKKQNESMANESSAKDIMPNGSTHSISVRPSRENTVVRVRRRQPSTPTSQSSGPLMAVAAWELLPQASGPIRQHRAYPSWAANIAPRAAVTLSGAVFVGNGTT